MLLRRSAPAIAILGAAAVALSACGGTNDDAPADTTATTTSAAAENDGTSLPAPVADLAALTTTLASDPCDSQLTEPVIGIITYQYRALGFSADDISVDTATGTGPGTMTNCTFTIDAGAAEWTVPTVSIATLPAADNALSTAQDGGKIAPIEPAPEGLDIRPPCSENDPLNPTPCRYTRIAYDQVGLSVEEEIAATGKTFLDTTGKGRELPDSGYRTVEPVDAFGIRKLPSTEVVGDDWVMLARMAPRNMSLSQQPVDGYVITAATPAGADPAEDDNADELTDAINSYLNENTPQF